MAQRLTQEIVNDTANRFFHQHNRRPSNREVYAQIGFGSNTKLTQYMAVWRQENSTFLSHVPTLPESLLKEMQKLQLAASKEVRERYEAELQHVSESEQAMILSCAELEALAEQQKSALQDFEQRLHAADSKLADAIAMHKQIQQQLDQERKASEALRLEAAKYVLQEELMIQLRLELKECQAELRSNQQFAAEALLREAVLQERISGLEKWVEVKEAGKQRSV